MLRIVQHPVEIIPVGDVGYEGCAVYLPRHGAKQRLRPGEITLAEICLHLGVDQPEVGRGEGEPRVQLMERAGKQGLGAAYRAGFAWGLERGYDALVEMAHRTWQEGFKVVEVPITFTERVSGVSKMSKQIVAEALLRVAQWAVTGGRRRARDHHPRSIARAGG